MSDVVERLLEDGRFGKVWKHGYHDDTKIEAVAFNIPTALCLAVLRALQAKESDR